MARHWSGTGPEYRLDWGDRVWILKIDAECPGLRSGDGDGPILGLEGIATAGRWVRDALSGSTLTGFEVRGGRVEATYEPRGWAPLVVRAAWGPSGIDGVDLEIEIRAGTGERLEALEIMLVSARAVPIEASAAREVWPRDASTAALSYDGREPDPDRLTTRPPGFPEGLMGRFGRSDGTDRVYAELVNPGDVSRRVVPVGPSAADRPTFRTGLFGFDLEKGVVFRSRLRGLWVKLAEIEARDRAFQAEPPPLST